MEKDARFFFFFLLWRDFLNHRLENVEDSNNYTIMNDPEIQFYTFCYME